MEHTELNRFEQYVLGSMMVYPHLIPNITTSLQTEAFHTIAHQHIYSAIVSTFDTKGFTDPMIVAAFLKQSGDLNRVGGQDYLYQIQANVVEDEGALHYVSFIKEAWTRRNITQVSTKLKGLATDETTSLSTILDAAQQEMNSLLVQSDTSHTHTIQEVLTEIGEDIEHPERNIGVMTGFPDVDLMTNGFQPGELVIIAARASLGKSTVLGNFMQNIGKIYQVPSLIFSLEMPAKQYILRMLSAETGLAYKDLSRGKVDDVDQLILGMQQLDATRVYVNDKSAIRIASIRSETRKLKLKYPALRVIAIDYLQLSTTDERHGTREREVGSIVQGLKDLAMELQITILAAAQLNRNTEYRRNRLPKLSDLRESGELEQTADRVIFLFREDYYDQESEPQDVVPIDFIFAKQRNGPLGTIRLTMNKPLFRLESTGVEETYG